MIQYLALMIGFGWLFGWITWYLLYQPYDETAMDARYRYEKKVEPGAIIGGIIVGINIGLGIAMFITEALSNLNIYPWWWI